MERARPSIVAPAALILSIGLIQRLQHAWSDALSLPDEAYWSLLAARDLSFRPNGAFQPLWVSLLSLVHGVRGVESFARAALTVGSIVDLLGALALLRLTRTLGLRPFARVAVMTAFVVSSFAVARATSGLEAPLTTACVIALVDLAAARPGSIEATLVRRAWVVGAIVGVAALAGDDARIAGILVLIAIAWRRRSRRWTAIAMGTATLVYLPYAVIALRTTGRIAPSSRDALAMILERLPEAWGEAHLPWTVSVLRRASSLRDASFGALRAIGVGGTLAAAAIGFALAALALARGRLRALVCVRLSRLTPLALVAAIDLLRLAHRPWDSSIPAVFAVVVIGLSIDHVLRSTARARVMLGAMTVLSIVAFVRATPTWGKPAPQATIDLQGARVGATSAGALAFFARNGVVVDLDGVSDRRALEAIRDGRLFDHVRAARLDRFTLDEPLTAQSFLGAGAWGSMREIAGNPRSFRVVTPDEKDALRHLDERFVELTIDRGAELLGDGWDRRGERGVVRSVGEASELVFVIEDDRDLGAHPAIEIELRAEVADGRGVQTIDVSLDDAKVAVLEVHPSLDLHTIPLAGARAGVHRLRFSYRWPRAIRAHDATWWRAVDGDPVRAIAAGRVRRSRGESPRLPPEGPSLGAVDGARSLTTGWLHVEGAGAEAAVWAIDREATMVFYSARNERPRTLRIVAGPPGKTADGDGQTITVVLNERTLGEVVLRPSIVEPHALTVPSGALIDGDNRLVLRFARLSPDPAAGVSRALYLRGVALE